MYFKKKNIMFPVLFFILSIVLYGCASNTKEASSGMNHNPRYSEKNLLVHFLNVGQGDSILIQINNKNLLIDAGPRESTEKVCNYLSSQGVRKLDYIIATHPHEDHIGGMAEVIKRFNVGEFYAPKKTAATKTFENMANALKRKKLKINVAKSGISLDLGTDVYCDILAPVNQDYEDVNNFSAVVKISYGQYRFLFMGDAEKLSEKEIILSRVELSSDVIKIGHHGSSSSSSKEFLDKVSPDIAVIMCGAENDYGHPHRETLEELKKRNIAIYRTDKDKDILLICDGKNINKN